MFPKQQNCKNTVRELGTEQDRKRLGVYFPSMIRPSCTTSHSLLACLLLLCTKHMPTTRKGLQVRCIEFQQGPASSQTAGTGWAALALGIHRLLWDLLHAHCSISSFSCITLPPPIAAHCGFYNVQLAS